MGLTKNVFYVISVLAFAGTLYGRGNVSFGKGGMRSGSDSDGSGSRPVQQAQPAQSQPVQRPSAFSGGGTGGGRSFSQPQVQRQAIQSQPRAIQQPQPQVQRQIIQAQPRVIQQQPVQQRQQVIQSQPRVIQQPQPQEQRQVIQTQPRVIQQPEQRQVIQSQPRVIQQPAQPQEQRQVIQTQPRMIQQPAQQPEQRQVIQTQPRVISTPSSGRTLGGGSDTGTQRNAPVNVNPIRIQPRSGKDSNIGNVAPPARDTTPAATPGNNQARRISTPVVRPDSGTSPVPAQGARTGSGSAPSIGRTAAPAEREPVSGRTTPARLVTPLRKTQPVGGGISPDGGAERARLNIPSQNGSDSGRTFGGATAVPAGSGRTSIPRISPLRKKIGGDDRPGDFSRPGDGPSRGTQPVLQPPSGDDRRFYQPGRGRGDGPGIGGPGRPDFEPGGQRPGLINVRTGPGAWCDDPCGPDFRPLRHRPPPRGGLPVFFNPWCFTYGVWGTSYGWWDSGPVYYDSWYDSSWSCSRVYYGGWRHGWYGGATYVHNPWYAYRSAYYYTEPVYVETPAIVETAPTTVVIQQPVVVPTAPTVVQTYPVVQDQPVQVTPAPVAQPVETAPQTEAAQMSEEIPCTCPCHCNGVRACICAYPCGSEYSFTDEVMELRQSFQSYAETLDAERIWASYEGQDRETDEADVEPLLR